MGLLLLSFMTIPVYSLASVSTHSLVQTTQSLQSSPIPQNSSFSPNRTPNYFGTDLGSFNTTTAPSGFTWKTSIDDSMTMNLPSVSNVIVKNSLVYFNSTQTAYQFSGAFGNLSVSMAPSQYSVKISFIASLLVPSSICLPFSASNPMIQGKTSDAQNKTIFLSNVRAGNEVFDWNDIPQTFSPVWNSQSSELCMNLPVGVTVIDPLALDGSGTDYDGTACSVSACSVTFSTSTNNDVLIATLDWFPCTANAVTSVTSSPSLTWTVRQTFTTACGSIGGMTYYYTTWASHGSITVTFNFAGVPTHDGIVDFGVSGATTGDCGSGGVSCFDTSAPYTGVTSDANCPTSGGNTNPCIFNSVTISNANDFIFDFGMAGGGGAQTAGFIAGHAATLLSQGSTFGNPMGVQYYKSSATFVSQTDKFGTAMAFAFKDIGDAILAASGAIQPILLTLLVSPSPSPEGGAIYKQSTVTTISSSTVVTISSSSTFTITAEEFASYIWFGWTGATGLVQDTINPTQTVSVTATATTIESSTITAVFSTTGSGGTGTGIDERLYALIILVVFVAMFAAITMKRRR